MSPLSFLLPQALLLALPLGLLLASRGRLPGPAGRLRWALAALLALVLARPVWHQGGDALDLVVIVDRSASMPLGSDASAGELLRDAEAKRKVGQRLGVIAFGREARVERPPTPDGTFSGFVRPVDVEASDLASAIDAAAELLSPEHAGRVLIWSDGRATGADGRAAARRLALRGVPVDFVYKPRPPADWDVAVTDLAVPAAVAAKEPFHLTAEVQSTRAGEVAYTLYRGDQPISHGKAQLRAGPNRLLFRERLEQAGLVRYRLELEGAHDAVPENDRGAAVVRVEGPAKVRVVSNAPDGPLPRALREAGLEVEVGPPPIGSFAELDGVAAVVLDDIQADALGDPAMKVLARFVQERGGGLLMTGGPDSFGQGGYLKSPLDELLPVSMELRKEQRKSQLAMVIAMDRSGSMQVAAADGRPKMTLAAEGAVAALQLLSEGDEAAVQVVDTSSHTIVPLTPIEGGLPLDKVASIRSEGGGIYIGVALEGAKQEILKSDKATRHIILFADANDSEEPANYEETLRELAKKHVTVSVIGMGQPTDSDADLLRKVAHQGGGRIQFSNAVTNLPRLFAQETITLARSSYIDTPVGAEVAPDLQGLGPPEATLNQPPRVGAYNLVYMRPGAGVAYRTADDAHAPLVSLWQRGLGRVVAIATPVEGPQAGPLLSWPGYRDLLARTVRWTMAPPLPRDAMVQVRRDGQELTVMVEVDPSAPGAGNARVKLLSGTDGKTAEAKLEPEDEGRLVAHFHLGASGTFHPVVLLGGQVQPAPPVTLPYAPEYEPVPAARGRELLEALARLSGGVERLGVDGLFEPTQHRPGTRELTPSLVALLLVGMLTEVLLRRVRFQPRRAVQAGVAPLAERPAGATPPGPPGPSGPATQGAPAGDVGSAMAQARARAKGRTE
jgi:hypothetical protein